MPWHLMAQQTWQIPSDHRCLIPWRQNSGFHPFPAPQEAPFYQLWFSLTRMWPGWRTRGKQKTLMASPALGSLNRELCLLIGLISMNNVLVFHSAQISSPKAWELARRHSGPLLRLDLCLFSWFSISRGYQLKLYYILQAVSVCVTYTQKTYLTGTRL